MQPHGVSPHGDVEGFFVHESLTGQVRRQNSKTVATPLELRSIRVEHPEKKRPAGPIEKEHDSVATGALPAVTDGGDPLGVEHPIVACLEHEIVVSEAMPFEERRAGLCRMSR